VIAWSLTTCYGKIINGIYDEQPVTKGALDQGRKKEFSSWEHNLETKISCRPTPALDHRFVLLYTSLIRAF
jgi:hypothetical protein